MQAGVQKKMAEQRVVNFWNTTKYSGELTHRVSFLREKRKLFAPRTCMKLKDESVLSGQATLGAGRI